jgi:hypothetical protein
MRSSWESGKRGALEHIILNLETEISKAAKRVAKKRAKG